MNGHDDPDARWKLALLRSMIGIRLFEQELQRQYDAKAIRGTIHTCIGQEAVAVGTCESLRKGDFVTSTHRGHGHFLAAGAAMHGVMAELFGRRTGYCAGKGGSQHMASVDHGFLGSNGITGGGIPYATGIALAIKMKGTANVAVCLFGDGASNQGTFHESINIAAIWRLPVVYVCENNQYAMSSRFQEMSGAARIADRAGAYGIVGSTVDGNDVLAVSRAMREAREHVLQGHGPVLLEAQTYRMRGHSGSDRCHYRPEDEPKAWAARCPIDRLTAELVRDGVIDEAQLAGMKAELQQEVIAAVSFAVGSEYLTREEALSGVYCEPKEVCV